jgi:hypothetical protein
LKKFLGDEAVKKLDQSLLVPWIEESLCKKPLDALCADKVDQKDLCETIRTPQEYRPGKHIYLQIIETIAGKW